MSVSRYLTVGVAGLRRQVPVWSMSAVLALTACGGSGADPAAAPVELATVVTLDHGGFRLRYDCAANTTLRFEYLLGTDTGHAARTDLFTLNDPVLPAGCGQQLSAGSYWSVQPGWDRGHLVTANHMDTTDELMAATFHMTNIVPQRSLLNQGIWQQTEEIAECHRDLAPVQVVGGVVYDDVANDHFVASHGIRTPDWFWKVLVTTDAAGAVHVIAWLIPNRDDLAGLDAYLVSVAELEARVGATEVDLPGMSTTVKSGRPAVSWPLPTGCGLG